MSDTESTPYSPPLFKRIDDPWIALLVLAIFILISTLIAMIILCFLWRRHRKRLQFYNENYILNNKSNGNKMIPVQIEQSPTKGYETQSMGVFVPQNDEGRLSRDLGEIHARFTPQDGIQEIHRVYERSKAYF